MKYSYKFILISFFCFYSLNDSIAQIEPHVLPMRDRADLMDNWLEERLDRVIPQLMEREKIEMWVLIAREYNEDPVILSMLPATWQSARRRTIIVFVKKGDIYERFAVSRYDVGRFFKSVWDKSKQPDQWKALVSIVEKFDPKTIALNYSEYFALGDGITKTEYELFKSNLSGKHQKRIVSGEKLAIGWLETRLPAEMSVYSQINRIAHRIIEEGLSEAVITPGTTTTADLQWWYREKIRERKLTAWFHPSVSIQRADANENDGDFSSKLKADIIQPGDLLHIDFGITYLRLNTDTQRHAYVLRAGETDIPEGLKKAFKTGNRLQDILMSEFKTGRTGNEILKSALQKAKEEKIVPSIYTHPIGFHGHAAGPTIGMWDQQEGVPGNGDYPVYANTAYSIELNVTVAVPEWNNKSIRIMLEEDAFFDGEKTEFIDGRQEMIYKIPRSR